MSLIENSETKYAIGFSYFKDALQYDSYQTREADGYSTGWCETMYDLSGITDDLIAAKKQGANFFHLLLEEWVNCDGQHRVSILYNEGMDRGIPSKQAYFFEPFFEWIPYVLQNISEETKRIPIFWNKRYNWQK